ncbi:MAG: hypothetical protein K5907_00860 [Treponema sp.]|nr:hypothetical protein [Treponema sp.]
MKKFLKKTALFAAVCVIFTVSNTAVFAESKQIVLGGKNGWPVFQYEDNVTTGKGRFGYDCIELATNSFVFDEYTDLLIDFEDENSPVSAGYYDVVSNNLKVSNGSLIEKSAGLSRNIGGLNLFGKPGTFFGSEGFMGSFSIEFWLCPSLAENGEVILNWESSKNVHGRLVYQLLNCIFEGGHLDWTISNLFDSYAGPDGNGEFHLKGSSTIIPDTWSYHALSFDCETGILEYLVNGVTEDLKYITSNGKESGEVSLIIMGTPAQVEFCKEYTGKIDEIRILRRPYTPPDYQSAEAAGALGRMLYKPMGGRFETKPIVVSTGAILNSLTAEMSEPSQTEVSFYVRSGDNYFNWTDSYPEWKSVESGKPITGVSGMYFQVMCELYPDGNGVVSPSVTQISLDFEELPLPLPPFTVKAQAGNGSVTLSWNYSVDETAGGYYIYYGNRPGEYLGRVALEGPSPINVGNTTSFTLTGLENGKIYYFAVASWSSLDDRITGPLSKEVFARPMQKLGK